MAISSNSCTFLSILLTFLCYLIFSCSASNQLSPSSAIASDQIKFWSENVQNKMPNSIMKKLSPMTKKDCDFYSHIMISKTDKFTADANFCALAKLACSSAFSAARTVENTYTTKKTYSNSHSFFHTQSTNEDPFSFFRLSMLKKDNLIHLPNLKESMPDRAFLPLKLSSKISLGSTDNILKIFNTPWTTTKESIETSVSYCNAEAIEGKTKSCPKSLEEMIKFSRFALGGKKLLALSSESTKGSNTELMIKNLKRINDANNIVACHEIFLPFATYFCHSLSSTNLYEVDLVEPKSRAAVNTMLAMCHMDTSPWPANHVAFQILKFRPGEGEACHWFTQLDLAWIAEGDSN